MALKDLVADASKIDEEAIEAIVAEFVRYDPAAKKIIFTPKGTTLKNEPKLLVFLVAMEGWKYVTDESHSAPTKPADLESATGIHGGSLRPILKKMKDSHLIAVTDGHYSVQTANLDSVRNVIAGKKVSASKTRKIASKPSAKAKATSADQGDEKKKTKNSAGQLRAMLEKWADADFFDEPKTIKNLLSRYHEHGVIVQKTSLSGLLLRAVRDGLLSRTKIESDGKMVWGYLKNNK